MAPFEAEKRKFPLNSVSESHPAFSRIFRDSRFSNGYDLESIVAMQPPK